MKKKILANKSVSDKKTPAVQKADTIDFIREAINGSRSVVKDIAREKNVASKSASTSQRVKSGSISIYYGKV